MSEVRVALEKLTAAAKAFRDPPPHGHLRALVRLDIEIDRAEKTLALSREANGGSEAD